MKLFNKTLIFCTLLELSRETTLVFALVQHPFVGTPEGTAPSIYPYIRTMVSVRKICAGIDICAGIELLCA